MHVNNLTVFFKKYTFKFEHKYFIVHIDNYSHIIVETSANIYVFGFTDTQF